MFFCLLMECLRGQLNYRDTRSSPSLYAYHVQRRHCVTWTPATLENTWADALVMASSDRTKSRPERAESAEISPLTKALLVHLLHRETVNGKAVFGVDS